MTWLSWLHHVSIHVPLVMTAALAVLGIWINLRTTNGQPINNDTEANAVLWKILRWGGWATVIITLIAVVSGILTADEFWTEDGPYVLIHHRNLGLTGFACVFTAVSATEWGMRRGLDRVRRFGALCWLAASFAMIGAGHWGGSGVHSDRIPWQLEPPVLRTGDK